MEKVKEKGYQIVSVSAVTLDTIAKPALKHSHKLMIEGSTQIEESVNRFIEALESTSHSRLGWIFDGMKTVNKKFNEITRSTIAASYKDNLVCIDSLESSLSAYQSDLEEYFRSNNLRVHHHWVFSQENRETINDLTIFIKNCTKDLKDIPYYKIWQYCIAFTCMQKVARQIIWKVQPNPKSNLKNYLEDVKFYCKYAVAIYGKLLVRVLIENKWTDLFASESEELIFCKYVGINEEQLLSYQLVSRKYVPVYSISVNFEKNSVIVAIRGTMSLFDCMTDLKSDYMPYTFSINGSETVVGKVHSGIMQSALNIDSEIYPIILSCMQEWPNFSIVVVGHSLGAGTATLLGLVWKQRQAMQGKNLTIFAYGPPPVLSESLNECLTDIVFSCVYGNDIVCRLSQGSIQDLAHMIIYTNYLETTNPNFSASKIATNWFNGRSTDSIGLINTYREMKPVLNSEKLVLCGNILQMYRTTRHPDLILLNPKSPAEVHCKFIKNSFYSEIVLDKTSLLDHMPNTYEEAIQSLSYSE